ncbi:hypothetical protein PAXRUDRAFT_612271 [Paxillus rubicundulus Ve08.2h10]|uniref:Uncharacterized protein n=1 Tax=Paxillus rubicundulus Ve08.2h10 TaxID=930991 RepID=A0A0D0DTE1_9AGAM|nr:hypothetical protein PAXRUDRAFT_612271 [Paxillus rubicundulus Ve08.2h10]
MVLKWVSRFAMSGLTMYSSLRRLRLLYPYWQHQRQPPAWPQPLFIRFAILRLPLAERCCSFPSNLTIPATNKYVSFRQFFAAVVVYCQNGTKKSHVDGIPCIKPSASCRKFCG